ncbi:hypothetical protein [Caldalkalibacillus salinus]|uniref:hypothetical protein n=1 Tax=Caldalkalibacillus salinus TaxID=2803787 RepID=UPI001920CD60|nr:hypothetical protein [Caldalkalibacillus salinus]
MLKRHTTYIMLGFILVLGACSGQTDADVENGEDGSTVESESQRDTESAEGVEENEKGVQDENDTHSDTERHLSVVDLDSEDWIQTDYKLSDMDQLQEQVNNGNRPGLLDPTQVALEFLHQMDVDVNSGSDVLVDQASEKVIQYEWRDEKVIQLHLIQPSEQGGHGIYVVNQYRYIENASTDR